MNLRTDHTKQKIVCALIQSPLIVLVNQAVRTDPTIPVDKEVDYIAGYVNSFADKVIEFGEYDESKQTEKTED
jgi:hypothetical protein